MWLSQWLHQTSRLIRSVVWQTVWLWSMVWLWSKTREKKRKKRIELPTQGGRLYANAQQETWGHVEAPGRLVYILYILSQHCTRVLARVYLYISSPHQSTTSHPPSLLLVHFILNSHKSTSGLPSWVEISTNVLSSEKFEALELLVEGWTPIPNIQYTQSTTLKRSMVS